MHFVQAKSILSAGNGMNIYRGCLHGCIYCDSRSLCYQMNHLFEDIEIKENAPQLLEAVLRSKRHRCMIGTGAMSDPYIPIEEKLGLTRRCLEIIRDHGFGIAIQTKSSRILRDLDLLRKINDNAKAVVQITMTTFDENLCRIVEPNVSTTRERFETILALRDAGIPTVVWFTPILPFINDTEDNVRGILNYCIEAGVRGVIDFGMGLTLREGDREYYYAALDRHFPGLKQRYISTYGNRYELPSPHARELSRLFHDICQANGIMHHPNDIFAYMREFDDKNGAEQLSLF